jgi:ABC-type multidrug transport system ATPase subunit
VKRQVGYLPDTVGFYDKLSAAGNGSHAAYVVSHPKSARRQRFATGAVARWQRSSAA